MNSLITDKNDLIRRIDNILDELKYIKNEIINDRDLSDVEMTQDVKESKFNETDKTLKAKKTKTHHENTFNSELDKPNKGYSDFYDINSRPEIKI